MTSRYVEQQTLNRTLKTKAEKTMTKNKNICSQKTHIFHIHIAIFVQIIDHPCHWLVHLAIAHIFTRENIRKQADDFRFPILAAAAT